MKHNNNLHAYLQASYYIDFQDPQIQALIKSFYDRKESELGRIQAAFKFVRDDIGHSYDVKNREVTRRASEVLEKRHGICYAKSHLLAAI